MDGNGRWARARGLPRIEGHRRGVENVRAVVRAARDWGVEVLTLFAFSTENWSRPPDEVNALMDLLERFLRTQRHELVQNRLKFRTIGRTGALPERIQRQLAEVTAATAAHDAGTLVLALNYSSRAELADAARALAEDARAGRLDPAKVEWDTFAGYLQTRDWPEPDLLIRTSGELRLSNFLLPQLAYTELYFTPTPWPEFGAEAFGEAIRAYRARERRFGQTGEQLRGDLQP